MRNLIGLGTKSNKVKQKLNCLNISWLADSFAVSLTDCEKVKPADNMEEKCTDLLDLFLANEIQNKNDKIAAKRNVQDLFDGVNPEVN